MRPSFLHIPTALALIGPRISTSVAVHCDDIDGDLAVTGVGVNLAVLTTCPTTTPRRGGPRRRASRRDGSSEQPLLPVRVCRRRLGFWHTFQRPAHPLDGL